MKKPSFSFVLWPLRLTAARAQHRLTLETFTQVFERTPAIAKPITKAELVAEIATRHNMTKAQANTVVDAASATIAALVVEGKTVTLPGLAKFEARARPARQVRNVTTGEMMDKPADRGVRISALSGIKKAVNEG